MRCQQMDAITEQREEAREREVHIENNRNYNENIVERILLSDHSLSSSGHRIWGISVTLSCCFLSSINTFQKQQTGRVTLASQTRIKSNGISLDTSKTFLSGSGYPWRCEQYWWRSCNNNELYVRNLWNEDEEGKNGPTVDCSFFNIAAEWMWKWKTLSCPCFFFLFFSQCNSTACGFSEKLRWLWSKTSTNRCTTMFTWRDAYLIWKPSTPPLANSNVRKYRKANQLEIPSPHMCIFCCMLPSASTVTLDFSTCRS